MTAKARPRAGTLLPLWFHHDPQFALPSPAVHLLVLVLTWTADHLTDGLIPASTLRSLAAATDDAPRAVSTLEYAGFLVLDSTGNATIPPERYLQFNLAAADVEAMKAMRSDVGRLGGRARAAGAGRAGNGRFTSRAAGQDQANGWPKPGPSPVSRLPSLRRPADPAISAAHGDETSSSPAAAIDEDRPEITVIEGRKSA